MSGQMVWDLFGTSANTGTADADGCRWTVASSEGWDSPDQRTQYDSPTGQHGQYGFNRFASGRQVVIKGLIFAPSQAAAWHAYDRVTSSMPGISGTGNIVAYEPVPKSLTVSQAGPPRVSKPAEDGTMTYWLTLMAEYPWKRALTPVSITLAAGGSATFTAAGTFPAELKVTTTSAGIVKVGSYGATIGTSASLPSGSVLDSMDRTIVDNTGADRYSLIATQSQWLAVVPGSNTFTNTGTASVVLSYFPTYA